MDAGLIYLYLIQYICKLTDSSVNYEVRRLKLNLTSVITVSSTGQVPASPHKKDLLNVLDRVPTYVQTLQFTVKDHTVGPSATFVKVDHVIRETKNLMCVINSVVTKCLECATKYNLDFNSIVGGISTGSLHGDDCSAGAMGDSKGSSNSTEGSM
uniref:Uncharacterized protein n=1 Tax=Glossina austeni TaxID=7395 RepID=A0A1A9VE93_GLOAU